MQALRLLFCACALLPCACSAFLAEAGKDLGPSGSITTREEVRKQLGTPVQSGEEFDEYITRRKISEPYRANSERMDAYCSFGFYEYFEFPKEFYLFLVRTFAGQTLRFTYGPDGKIVFVTVDGQQNDPHWH
jgi:hypothetical protein